MVHSYPCAVCCCSSSLNPNSKNPAKYLYNIILLLLSLLLFLVYYYVNILLRVYHIIYYTVRNICIKMPKKKDKNPNGSLGIWKTLCGPVCHPVLSTCVLPASAYFEASGCQDARTAASYLSLMRQQLGSVQVSFTEGLRAPFYTPIQARQSWRPSLRMAQ